MKKGERAPEQQEKFEIVKRLLAAGGYSDACICEIACVSPNTVIKYKRILDYPIRIRGRVQRKFFVPPRIAAIRDELTAAFLIGDLVLHGKLCSELQRELKLIQSLEAAE